MSEYVIENTVQPITNDFSSDGMLDEFSRVDHQHPLSESLKRLLGLSSGGSFSAYNRASVAGRNLLDNGQFKINQRAYNGTAMAVALTWRISDRWKLVYSIIGMGAVSGYGSYPSAGNFDSTSQNHLIIQNGASFKTPLVTSDYFIISQAIEGYRLQELQWGTSLAKSLTLTIYLQVSIAGTYIVEFLTASNYSISRALVCIAGWNKLTVTIPGLTVSTPTYDSSAQLSVFLWFAAGPDYNTGNVTNLNTNWAIPVTNTRAAGCTNHWSAINRQINITDVQLEIGTVATSVENITFADTLKQCMRHYEKSYDYAVAPGAVSTPGAIYGIGRAISAISCDPGPIIWFKVRKRAIPSMLFWRIDSTANAWLWNGGNAAVNIFRTGENSTGTYSGVLAGLTIGQAVATDGHWTANAEI